MNIFLHELRQYKKSIIIWTLSLSILGCLFLMLYPSYSADLETVKKLFEGFPPAFRAAFSLNLDTFFSLFGFFAYIMTFIVLAGSIQAMNIAVGIVSKEGTGKTVDFLLSKPVTRNKVLLSKLLAGMSALIITNIFFIVSVLISASLVAENGFDIKPFFLVSLSLLITQMMFFGLGFIISVLAKKIKSIVSVSLPVVFSFYILGMFDGLVDLDKLRYFTPFKFFDPLYIMDKGSYEYQFVIIAFVFTLISISLSFWIYNKKDIGAVD